MSKSADRSKVFEKSYPLSFEQEYDLMFIPRGDTNWHEEYLHDTYRLRQPVDIGALRECLDGLVERHETLRSLIELGTRGAGCQNVLADSRPQMYIHKISDLRSSGPNLVQQELAKLAKGNGANRREYRLRVDVVRLAKDDWIINVQTHCLFSDGLSFQILTSELSALYKRVIAREKIIINRLPIQYGEYSIQQHHHWENRNIGPQLTFWNNQLGSGGYANLGPTNRGKADSVGVLRFDIPAETVSRVSCLAASLNSVPMIVYLTTYKLLMARALDSSHIWVEILTAGRQGRGLSETIGPFVRYLSVRTDCSGNPDFREALERVQRCVMDATTNYIPGNLCSKLGIAESLRRALMFQYFPAVGRWAADTVDLDSDVPPPPEGVGFQKINEEPYCDCELRIEEGKAGSFAYLLYNRSILSDRSIQALAGAYQRLINEEAHTRGFRMSRFEMGDLWM